MSYLVMMVLVLVGMGEGDRPPGLYGEGGGEAGILVLNETNFHSSLGDRDHFWLVEFYASWCGYCQSFAPTFTGLAREMVGWRDVIKVAAIDCGDEVNNREVCMHANITGFPTIKYYPPRKEINDTGVNRVSHDHSKKAIKEDTIDFIETVIESEEYAGIGWPDLASISPNRSEISLEDIWPEGNEDTFVVVEPSGSYMGRQLVLSTWRRVGDYPVVRRITTSKTTLTSLGVRQLPAVLVLNREQQDVVTLKPAEGEDDLVRGWWRAVNNYVANKALRNSGSFRRTTVTPNKTSTTAKLVETLQEEEVRRRRYSVFLSDLEKTVVFALTNEVGLLSEISGDQSAALQQFVSTLVKWFPRQSRLGPALDQLSDLLDSSNTSLQTKKITDLISPLALDLVDTPWRGCRGSQARFGGYSCGLWMLWHQLTVSQYDQGVGEAGDVLRAMVEYVRHFFSCIECSEHFLAMVENGTRVKREVGDYREQVLFLWRDHNKVNLRLVKEAKAKEDPLFPKTQFPAPQFCPDCNDSQDEDAVFSFLHNMYTSSSLISREGQLEENSGVSGVGRMVVGPGVMSILLVLVAVMSSHPF